jgi:predicted PurR-regulated permease PerM
MLGAFILMGWLHLATPFLVALFSYLALTKLHFLRHRGKWAPIVLFLFTVFALIYGLGFFISQTVRSLPEIADKAIPSTIQWAQQHEMELPAWFTDYDRLREVALDAVKNQVRYLASFARFARGATSEIAFVIVGIIVAIGLFLNPELELYREQHRVRENLYSVCCDHIAARFAVFYRSFAIVMGAQIVISAINTVLTTAFALAVHLPYTLVIVGMTFLCGLLPVIGNLISNSIVLGIGFTVSPKMALIALIFLVVVHKLEYFLNGKIVGDRIHNPLWLTLLALVLGERLMGIPGMILAPVVLSYVKLEASAIEVKKMTKDGGAMTNDE